MKKTYALKNLVVIAALGTTACSSKPIQNISQDSQATTKESRTISSSGDTEGMSSRYFATLTFLPFLLTLEASGVYVEKQDIEIGKADAAQYILQATKADSSELEIPSTKTTLIKVLQLIGGEIQRSQSNERQQLWNRSSNYDKVVLVYAYLSKKKTK